jgi:hypothetical protein
MTDVFTIRLDHYTRVCQARSKAGLECDFLLLGVLTDMGPFDAATGDYISGETLYPVEDVWKKLSRPVPEHLRGGTIRILRED